MVSVKRGSGSIFFKRTLLGLGLGLDRRQPRSRPRTRPRVLLTPLIKRKIKRPFGNNPVSVQASNVFDWSVEAWSEKRISGKAGMLRECFTTKHDGSQL